MKDPYILAKALAYAIVAIEARPNTDRERADYSDMVFLFRKLPASERDMFLDEARRDLLSPSEHASFELLPQEAASKSRRTPEITPMKLERVEAAPFFVTKFRV